MSEDTISRKRVREHDGSEGTIQSIDSSSSSNSTNRCAYQVQEQISKSSAAVSDTGTAAAATAAAETPGDSRLNNRACLRKGMVILKRFISPEEQTELAAHVGRLGELRQGGFYSCNNEKTKRMRMMNLGLRTDGRRHDLEIPQAWTEVAVRACRLAAGLDPSIPVLRPDICVVNHYTAASRLGWHQDLFSSRDPGLPVVSLSLGQSATFRYRLSWKKNAGIKSVKLESGDALIFGGRSRGIIHGVPGIDAAVSGGDAVVAEAAKSKDGAPVGESWGRGQVGVSLSRQEEDLRPSCMVPGGGRFNLNFREL